MHKLQTAGGLLVAVGMLAATCALPVAAQAPRCADPSTTAQVSACAAAEMEQTEAQMQRYLSASLTRWRGDPELAEAIEEGQARWSDYAQAHCAAVYTMWREGTIRNAMALACRTRLIRERTHTLWSSYLTYMDGTPPALPEPSSE